ncbi:MAG: dipeptide/oligopeptide/nickel ABC transporter ATP-binding protein [Bryobacteraceae bacterium]
MPADALLRVRGLGRSYPRGGGAFWAVRDVWFELARGRILGVVGASGSGKSTLARCLAMVEPATRGELFLEGRLLSSGRRGAIQLIFQQPAATLNPRFTAEEIVSEPLRIQNRGTRAERRRMAFELMELVGLPPGAAHRKALESSGGERQRLAIARGLALSPSLLILDESLSGLDLSIQAQILNLLVDLQERRGLTSILISHDLGVVAQIADEIAVMDAGTIVEHGAAVELLARPRHARTRELLDAAALLAPGGWR